MKSKFIDLVQQTLYSDSKLTFELDCPRWYAPIEVIVVCFGAVRLHIKTDKHFESWSVVNSSKVHILSFCSPSSKIEITLESDQPFEVHQLGMVLDYMGLLRPVLDETIISKSSQHNISHIFDFSKVIKDALGWDKYKSKEIQLRWANNDTITVQKTTNEFVWQKNRFTCKLRVGRYSIRLRIRGKKQGWSKWSKWLFFKNSRQNFRANSVKIEL